MRQIPLTQGLFAIVDDEDYAELSRVKWHAAKRSHLCYATRKITEKGRLVNLPMQNAVMGVPPGVIVDHKDCDGLNNTRENLRVCTKSGNQHNQRLRRNNTSGYKGVSRDKSNWRAQIALNSITKHLGNFKTPEEAARAYDAAARKMHGEFATTNDKQQERDWLEREALDHLPYGGETPLGILLDGGAGDDL